MKSTSVRRPRRQAHPWKPAVLEHMYEINIVDFAGMLVTLPIEKQHLNEAIPVGCHWAGYNVSSHRSRPVLKFGRDDQSAQQLEADRSTPGEVFALRPREVVSSIALVWGCVL